MEWTGKERNGKDWRGKDRYGGEWTGLERKGTGRASALHLFHHKKFMYTVNMIQLERTGQGWTGEDWRGKDWGGTERMGKERSGEDGNAVARALALRFSFVINNLVI